MKNTKIEWTATYRDDGTVVPGHTFNPWIGCQKVSTGCKFCYAESLMDHRWGKVEWGPQGTRKRTSDSYWRQPITWDKAAEKAGERHRVFCASLADVFEDNKQVGVWRAELFELIGQTPHLDWLLLTKRPENVNDAIMGATGQHPNYWLADHPNVWIGTSVEDQAAADERIPALLKVSAAVRFLSCEPLLGPVDLRHVGPEDWDVLHGWKARARNERGWANTSIIHWVIVGGESGPKARRMRWFWAQYLLQQCQVAGVPFFMKQLGSYWANSTGAKDRKGEDPDVWPVSLRVREFPNAR